MMNRCASNNQLIRKNKPKRVGSTESTSSTFKLDLDLDANHIQCVIQWLCDESSDEQMSQSYRQRYHSLADHHTKRSRSSSKTNANSNTNHPQAQTVWAQEELFDIITAIQTLLSSVQEPSSFLVAEAHTTIGIIHQRLSQDARATQSFTQALWVQSCGEHVCPVAVGLTKTRLALAYGRKGDYDKAISLLEKAMQDYQQGGLTEEDELFSKANEALQGFHFAENHRSSKHRSSKRQNSRRISQGAA